MKCMRAFQVEFLHQNMTKRFMQTTFNNKQKDKLFENEKQFLPMTQKYIEKKGGDEEQGKREFHPCPIDTCKGYIDHSTWKCGLCHISCCDKCLKCLEHTQHKQHRCQEEDLLTLRMLLQETKPCPKCKAPCSKVDGCDQVFAMCCKTTFSWATGLIDKTGYVHSPDYYKWMNERGATIPNNNPAAIPDIHELDITKCDHAYADTIIGTHTVIHNMFINEIPFYIENTTYTEKTNLDLRITYLTSKSEANFKTQLGKRYKIYQGRERVLEILQHYISDAIGMLQECTREHRDLKQISHDLIALKNITNDKINSLKTYWDTIALPTIRDDWFITYD